MTAVATIRAPNDAGTVIRHHQRTWTGVNAAVTERHCAGPFAADFDAGCDQVVAMLSEVGGRVEMRPASERAGGRQSGSPRPLSLIPSGLRVRGSSGTIRFVRQLVIGLDLPALAAVHGHSICLPATFRARLMFDDARLLRLCELIAAACTDPARSDALYCDSLTAALLASLLDANDAAEPDHGVARLMPWQLRAAVDFMEQNLQGEVRLRAVADRVRLSCSHFSRGFRQSTGLAPHQWLIKARIERAQGMLLDTALPLADVALAVGFCDQAHFTRTFSKVVGVSPGAWRRACRPDRTAVSPRPGHAGSGAGAAYLPSA